MSKKKAAEELNKTPETEKTAKTEETKKTEEESRQEPKKQTEEVPDQAAELQKKLDDLNDRFVRLAAEYDNFRKRSQREREQIYGDAVSHTVKSLLITVDNLERALKQPTEDIEYKKGIEMTYNQLLESLKSLQVTMIEAAPGTPFDPNLHNAVMHIENEELGENVIAEVFQQGFSLNGKVIRHSMVQVAN